MVTKNWDRKQTNKRSDCRDYYQKDKRQCVDNDVEKREPCTHWWKCELVRAIMENSKGAP